MEAGRLLLFVCLYEQAANANDNKAKLKNFGCTHEQPPFLRTGGKKLPPEMGAKPPPLTGSAIKRIPQRMTKCNDCRHSSTIWSNGYSFLIEPYGGPFCANGDIDLVGRSCYIGNGYRGHWQTVPPYMIA